MRIRARTATALAVTIALATPLTACKPNSTASVPDGSQTTTPSPTPTVLPDAQLRQATRMTLDAPSKRITGSAAAGSHNVTFDVTFIGEDAKGTKISSAPGISTTVEFVRVGEYLFINADEHYWQSYYNLEVLQYLIDKWVRIDADDPKHTDLLVLQVNEQVEPAGTVAQTGAGTIDGRPVVVLKDTDGHTFYVAAEGEPYLLRFEGTQASPVGVATVVVTFSEFGTASGTIAAPTGEIFDPERDFPDIASGHD
jgi:hypothetical protein